METTLFFRMGEVLPLIDHALCSSSHVGTLAQTYDENFDPIENQVIPPGLIWVKDEGIYLLSNGAMKEGETPLNSGLISYAMGYDPQKDSDVWEKSRFAAGENDFAEALAIGDSIRRLPRTGFLFISVGEGFFEVGWSKEARRWVRSN